MSVRTVPPVCMITGASAGIGRATALELARRGAEVWLVCRDPARADQIAREIGPLAHPLIADLRSFSSVRALARVFLRAGRPLHALINNAGVIARSHELTEDGIETTFAVNYLSHY